MSGFVGIVNLDRAPIDPELLRQLTQHMAFRGPDAQATWINSHVGFGHAMLRTTFEMAEEQQPRGLDGRVWITADARIDARDELIDKLEAKVRRELARATDAELILHAYQVWDTSCVDHLLGDFAFALWDAPRQRLFCARDHFGVRQFYYAQVGGCLIFSNNLDTLRLHPRVSDKLNDLAIVNFLLFRYQPRIDQTSFADIQSLLPAHTLIWEGGATTISRYWTLPIEDPIQYKRHGDYVYEFLELLEKSVADRMRIDRAGILMSGRMDLPSIAATIRGVCLQKKDEFKLKAFTYVYNRLIPDQERHYAGLVADYLDIPIKFVDLDDAKAFDGWEAKNFRFPQPVINDPFWKEGDCIRDAAVNDGLRVFYVGWGPDVMLGPEPAHYIRLLRTWRIADLIQQTGDFVIRYHRRPPLYIRAMVRQFWQRLLKVEQNDGRPDAVAMTLLASNLAERIEVPNQWWQFTDKPQMHPWRPLAYSSLTDHYWSLSFQGCDAANWRAPIEFRCPYFDIRLVQFFLRMPVLPWCASKLLLREAMRDKLPELVRERKKSTVPGEPKHAYADWVHGSNFSKTELGRYVSLTQAKTHFPDHKRGSEGTAMAPRLIALNHWLQRYTQHNCERP